MRTLVRSRYPAPIILPAERIDIPELVRVVVDAQRSSVLNFYAYPTEEDKAKAAALLTKILEDNWGAPHLLIIKALDPDTKVITAMAIWQLKGYSKEELAANPTKNPSWLSDSYQLSDKLRFHDPPCGVMLAAGMLLQNTKVNSQNEGKSPKDIEKYVGSQMRAFFDSWTDPTKHIYLAFLMTDPRFQRRGIGTAMLDWGHRRADKDEVPSFLVASPFGHGLYLKVGWKDVETPIELDLKDWVPDAQNGDMGWGTYKFYYMIRMPKSAAEPQ